MYKLFFLLVSLSINQFHVYISSTTNKLNVQDYSISLPGHCPLIHFYAIHGRITIP